MVISDCGNSRRGAMLNESHVEGVIASKWSYNEVQFVRVAVYPDAGRTARRADV